MAYLKRPPAEAEAGDHHGHRTRASPGPGDGLPRDNPEEGRRPPLLPGGRVRQFRREDRARGTTGGGREVDSEDMATRESRSTAVRPQRRFDEGSPVG